MIAGLVVGALTALGVAYLAGARRLVQVLFALAFLPFLSVDPSSGGLVAVEGLGGTNVRLKLALRAATALGLCWALVRRRDAAAQLARLENAPIALFIVWALIGMARGPSATVRLLRLAEFASFFLAAQALYLEVERRAAPRDVARWHLTALLPLCTTALAYLVIDPTIAAHVGPGGLRLGHRLIEANVLGLAGALSFLWAVFCLWETRDASRRERAFALVVGLVGLVVLLLARSRTAMVSVVVGALLVWAPLGDRRRWPRFLFGLGLAALAGVALQDTIYSWMLRGAEQRDLMTGTGRTLLWKALLCESFPRHPWLGAGYLALDEGGPFAHAGTQWVNAHSTYLFGLISLGIPGFVLTLTIVLLPLARLAGRVRRAPLQDRAALRLLAAAQLTVVVSGLTSFGVAGPPNAAMLFSLGLYPYAVHGARRSPVPRRGAALGYHGVRGIQPAPAALHPPSP